MADLAAAQVPAWAVQVITDAGRRMDARNWVPATAGNLSVRLDDGDIAITRSGCHKGHLDRDGIMLVDLDGQPITSGARPSAETGLHLQIYRAFPGAGAVLHGHSIAATVLSLRPGDRITLAGYELLKAFDGQRTHDAAVDVPVFDNDQDISRLAAAIAPHLPTCHAAYAIRGHGVYAWGPDMDTALVRLEALEFLLACELAREHERGRHP